MIHRAGLIYETAIRFRARRSGLSLSVTLLAHAALLGACASAPPLSPWEMPPKRDFVEERTIEAMSSTFRIRLWKGNRSAAAGPAFDAAIAEIRRVAAIADPADPRSEISRINTAAARGPVQVSRELFALLEIGQKMWSRTGGIFDVTFAPIQEATEKDGADAGLSAGVQEHAAEVEQELKSAVGTRNLVLDSAQLRIRFTRPGMKLGILGLAKGYAVQRAAEKLARLNPGGFAVLGGGVLAAGGAALQDAQLMCIEHPNQLGTCAYRIQPRSSQAILYLAQSAVAERPGHIYDAKNGLRKARAGGVTIAAQDGAWAQAAATAASAMDNKKAAAFLKRTELPRISGVYFDSDYSIVLYGSLEPYAKTSQSK